MMDSFGWVGVLTIFPLSWVEIKPHHFISTIRNMGKDRNKGHIRMRTSKYIDRLTYDPSRHKRKEVRKRLQALQARQMEQHVPGRLSSLDPSTSMGLTLIPDGQSKNC